MIATLVHVRVKPEHIMDFIAATAENHQSSVLEQGNLRFDVLQDRNDNTKFTLYEAYRTDADAAGHKKTAHYLKWKETVEDWMQEPRQGVPHTILCPGEHEI